MLHVDTVLQIVDPALWRSYTCRRRELRSLVNDISPLKTASLAPSPESAATLQKDLNETYLFYVVRLDLCVVEILLLAIFILDKT